MIPGILIGLLWLSVVWRVGLTVHTGVTRERRSLTLALVFFAVSATAWVFGRSINALLGMPNLSTLLVRLALGACWIVAQPFVVQFLYARIGSESANRSRRWAVVTTLFMMMSCTVLWIMAPIHEQDLQTLDAAPDTFTTSLIIISYVWVQIMLGALTIAGVRAFLAMADDVPGRVSAVFISLTGLLGLIGIALLAVERVLHLGSSVPSQLGVLGGAVMPLAAATAALGMFAVPALEWVLELLDARRRIRALQPAWVTVRRDRPELIVTLPFWTRILDAPLVAERMRIEIMDAADTAGPQPS